MKIEALTVAYDKDLERLKYQYESFKKFCRGFTGYTVVIDDHLDDCVKTQKWLEENGINYKLDTQAKRIGKGYVRQQFMKMNADDIYDDPQTWVCHIDCDSMFTQPFHVNSFFNNKGQVIYWREAYKLMAFCMECSKGLRKGEFSKTICPNCGGDILNAFDIPEEYKRDIEKGGGRNLVGAMYRRHYITSTAIKEPVMHEYMRRMPLLYKNRTIARAKDFFISQHGMTILDYLKDLDNFSEYNFLGAFCNRFYADDYQFEAPDNKKQFPFRQLWSHGEMNITDVLTGKNSMSSKDFNEIRDNIYGSC